MRRFLPLALVLATAACSSSPAAPSEPGGPAPLTKMVCENEVRQELAATLGVDTPAAPTATWAQPTYTCVYAYPEGKFTMTVQEMADKTATTTYFGAKRDAAKQHKDLPGIGDGAFALPDGSIYLRKDATVLFVDVSGLPARFGRPPIDHTQVALMIVSTVMHCWVENS